MYSYATGKKCLSNEYVGEMFFFSVEKNKCHAFHYLLSLKLEE